MATFARYTGDGVTTSATIRTTTTDDILIGMNVANVGAGTASVSVLINDGTADINVIKDVSVPVGGNIELVDGKIVLETGDALKVVSDVAVDVWATILEGVNL